MVMFLAMKGILNRLEAGKMVYPSIFTVSIIAGGPSSSSDLSG
jgi:hypothetical protein